MPIVPPSNAFIALVTVDTVAALLVEALYVPSNVYVVSVNLASLGTLLAIVKPLVFVLPVTPSAIKTCPSVKVLFPLNNAPSKLF